MSMQAMARWLGEPKKVALLLLAAGLAAVAALGLASAASAATFSNTDGITINDGSCDSGGEATAVGSATPYPSEIAVSGLGSSVLDVNVTVSGLSHTFPDDIGLLLVSPEGQSAILMTDSGGGDNVSGIELIFDDAASSGLPDNNSQLSSGTYRPSQGTVQPPLNCSAPASFPKDATGTNPPAGPYGASLSVFDGSDPNGTWKLYTIDDSLEDTGSISGWSLDISATPPADTTPPTVTETSPLVPKKSDSLTATFSEPVTNVGTSTFILERKIAVKKAPPKYVLVDATVTPSADGLSAVLDPAEDLPKGDYRATITTDVTDLADNNLDQNSGQEGTQPKVWFFTVTK